MSENLTLYKDGIHDDTAALQSLLDNSTGTVILSDGEYLISDTLKIHDNTRLCLSHRAIVRLADDACCIMLANDKFGLDGRNKNIFIEGGTWDGNNANQRRGKVYPHKPFFRGIAMRFEGIEDLTVANVTFKDPEAYALQIMDADRFTVENITFDFNMLRKNMDGVHVQGPARNGYIRNIKGATNDDLVALNCDDYYENFNEATRSKGDIENITVDGLYADNGYTAVRLLSCGSKMRNINIKNVFGTYRYYGVSFTHHNIFPGEPVWFDGINIDGVYCSKHPQDPPVDRKFIDGIDSYYGAGTHNAAIKYFPIIWFAQGVRCGYVSISNLHRTEEAVTRAHTIQIDKNVDIERLVLSNVTQRFTNCPPMPITLNDGDVHELVKLTEV